jgi:hypothetical protein
LCATAKISFVITVCKDTIKRNWRTIKLTRSEIIAFILGLIFMLTAHSLKVTV